ncbi:MAG: peptide chain release factor N(5)-glutamine methyltransferase [Paenibacillaceae bacterium]|nr:peptide chain release factor N(5)-glutamine methyltransferase [Paenibacillaceae bacterium]
MAKAMTIREAYLQASSFLRERGVTDDASCAELLLQHLLGWDRTGLLLRWAEPFPAELAARWERLLARKAAGEPLQYITGRQEFYGLPFRVTGDVLIPRPETELLVEAIVAHGRRLWPDGAPLLADVGTGSGAIAVSAAVLCPRWRVVASDLSAAALEVARGNAEANGVAPRIDWLRGDLLAPHIEHGLGIDILVSNPPYIPSGDIAGLQTEVRDFEPHTALDGGADGLDLYRRMIGQLRSLSAVPRLVGFEVGQGQAADVADMLRAAGHWDEVGVVDDLAGIGRHVVAVCPATGPAAAR